MGGDTALGTPLVVRVGVGAYSANASRKNTEYRIQMHGTKYKIQNTRMHKYISV